MAQYRKRTSTGNYTIYLLVEDVDTDITNNRSKIQYKAYIVGNSGTLAWGSGTWSTNIAGTSSSGTMTYDFGSTNTYYYAGSSSSYVKTGYITHDPDGTKTVTVSLSISGPSLVGSATISTTFTLNTIPRTSSLVLSSTAFTISDMTTGFAYRIDSAARFYHKVIWTLGGSETTAKDQVLINGTGDTWFIMPSDMLAKLPDDYQGTMTITAITYRDQAETTEIGRVPRNVTVGIDTAVIKPSRTIGDIVLYNPNNTAPIRGYLIAGYTKPQFTYSYSNKIHDISTGSKVSECKWQVVNKSTDAVIATKVDSSESFSGNGTYFPSDLLPSSANDYYINGTFYAKDNRGGYVLCESTNALVYGYTKPNAELNAYRTLTESGTESTVEDGTGTYVYITFSGSESSSINDQNTVQSIDCSISIDGGTAQTVSESGAHFYLRDSESAIITLRVTDKVDYSEVTVAVPPAKYPLDLYDSGDGSVGAGIGGAAKANSFHVYLDQHGYSGKKIVYHTSTGDSIEHDLAGLLFDESGGTGGGDSGGGTGTNNYNELNNKPSINGATLQGNVTLATLGIQPAGNYATESYVTNYHDNTKQDKLTAGDNITIDGNTISSTGGISGRDRTKLDNAITGVTLVKDTDTVLGTGTTFTLTNPTISAGATTRYLSASASGTAVGADGTASVIKSISSAKASVPIPTAKTSKLVTTTIPNVTSAGSASTWVFSMGDGTTYDNETLVISGANSTAPTLGTAITAATGSVASDGGGATVSTGLNVGSMLECDVNIGTTTETVLTGVKVTTQPTITLTANSSTATGRITYVQSSSPSLSGGGITVGTNDQVTVLTDSTSITTSTS